MFLGCFFFVVEATGDDTWACTEDTMGYSISSDFTCFTIVDIVLHSDANHT